MLSFFVPGIPVPKGSAKAFYVKSLGRAVVTQTNREKQRPWASMISVMAQQAGAKVTDGPMSISLSFVFSRPRSHYGTGRNAGAVKASAPLAHVTKPDVDKLVRCVLDALTGVAWRDDSQVVRIDAGKMYGTSPGVRVVLKGGGDQA